MNDGWEGRSAQAGRQPAELPSAWAPDSALRALIEAAPVAIVAVDETGAMVLVNARASELFGYDEDALLGLGVERLIPERLRGAHVAHRAAFARHPEMRPMGSGIELLGLREDGSEFPIEAGLSAVEIDGERVVLTSIIDLTRRKQVEALLERRVAERTRELERRRRVAASLRDTLKVLNSSRSLDEILGHVVLQATELLGARSCALYRYHVAERRLEVRAEHGSLARPRSSHEPLGAGFCVSQAVLEGRPVASGDLAADLAGAPDGARLEHARALLRDGFGAILAVPLQLQQDEIYGALELCYAEPRDFNEEQVGLAVTLADQAALAVENSRLRRQAAHAAVTAERNRIARDLHDSVTQTLFSASMIAEVLPRLWERSETEGRRRLEEMRQLTRGALAEMRALLLELRPRTLAEVPLADLLVQLGEATAGRSRLPIEVAVEGAGDLSYPVKEALYRITQEALNNVAKHARASHAWVDVRAASGRPAALILQVRDDGQGFDPLSIPAAHLGLTIMRERAEAIDAELSILTRPTRGTTIQVVWPQMPPPELA